MNKEEKKEERLRGINPMVIPGVGKRTPVLEIKQVWEVCLKYFDLSAVELKSKSRKREIVTSRHIFYYLAKKYTRSTNRFIGEYSSNEYWDASPSNVLLMGNKVKGLIGSDTYHTVTIAKLVEILEANKYG